MKLIDAEAFEKSVRTDFWEHYTDCHDTDQTDLLELIMDNLAEQPTIEAKPVVHAHWEQVITVVKKIHEYEQEDIQYRCDHCGHIVDDFENYCGGCGAQMFEGVKIPVISMEDVPKIMEEMKNNA